MYFYVKKKWLGAIYVEFGTDLGIKPLYSFRKWKNEFIFDLPWTQIILTPASALYRETENVRYAEYTNPCPHIPPAGHPTSHPEG